MLDTQHNHFNNTQNVEIKPPCIGTLQKSHPKSFFVVCHVTSEYKKNYVDEKSNVLQLMVFGDNLMMAEILPDDVYEEWVKQQQTKEE